MSQMLTPEQFEVLNYLISGLSATDLLDMNSEKWIANVDKALAYGWIEHDPSQSDHVYVFTEAGAELFSILKL